MSLEQFLRRKLETLVHTRIESPKPDAALSEEARERGLDEWLDSFSQGATLSENAFHRADWYPDRW